MAAEKKQCTLVSSFLLPNEYRAFGIVAVNGDRAWVSVFNLPMVLLLDSAGQVHQTRFASDQLKKIHQRNGIFETLEAARKNSIECLGLAADNHGNCIVVVEEQLRYTIKVISQSGAVSTVISGLKSCVDSAAYLPMSEGKGKILFGHLADGMCSIDWPRGFLSGLFSSSRPVPFERLFPFESQSIAVDTHSDLISVGDKRNKLFILNKDGQNVSEYAPEEKDGFCPKCVAFDHNGHIIVLNEATSSVVRISPKGQLLQTILPEIGEDAQICEECKKLRGIPPKCRECKDKVRIVAISVYEDMMWVSRLSGEVERYRLL